MDSLHPLYRFDVAMAIMFGRSAVVTPADIAGLPEGEFLSPTVIAYRNLLADRVVELEQSDPLKVWRMPHIDIAFGTMTVWSNHGRFRIVLSWGTGQWVLRAYGRPPDSGGPRGYALRWIVADRNCSQSRVRDSLDFFTRTMAILAVAGVEEPFLLKFSEIRSDRSVQDFVRAWLLISMESSVDDLFRRAALTRAMPVVLAA